MAREREIDGLRAFAILAVLLYHLDVSKYFAGGFIGVDVFFVISGYVITVSLRNKMLKNEFTFLTFLGKRIRRLLPALLTVVLVTNSAALFILDAENRKSAGKLSTSGLLAYSNIQLWMESGYHDTSSRLKLYLHTWSLSVEWQYYITWSFVCLVLSEIDSYTVQKVCIFGMALLSLIFSEKFLNNNPTAVFFHTPFRYCEFLCGSFFAWRDSSEEKSSLKLAQSRSIREIISILGITILSLYVAFFDSTFPFPGLSSLPVCVASILIISYSRGTLLGSVLTLRPVLFLGDISYSVYLVHWPLIVLYEYKYRTDDGSLYKFLILSVSIMLGYFLYNFVEKPFMSSESATKKNKIVLVLFGLSLLLSLILQIDFDRFIPRNKSWLAETIERRKVLEEDRQREIRNEGIPKCFYGKWNLDPSFTECNPNREGKPEIVLHGDSHASDLYYSLSKSFPEASVTQMCGGGCNFYSTKTATKYPHCVNLRRSLQENIPKRLSNIALVILTHAWRGRPFSANFDRIFDTIKYFSDRNIKVVVFGIRPYYEKDLDIPLEQEMARHEVFTEQMALEFVKSKQHAVYEDDLEFKRLISETPALYISQYQIMCNETKPEKLKSCTYPFFTKDFKNIVYYGRTHLNRLGAQMIIDGALPTLRYLINKKNSQVAVAEKIDINDGIPKEHVSKNGSNDNPLKIVQPTQARSSNKKVSVGQNKNQNKKASEKVKI